MPSAADIERAPRARRSALVRGMAALGRMFSAAADAGATGYQETYRGGSRQRSMSRWQPPGASADAAIGGANDLLTRRMRDLARNFPWSKATQRKTVLRTVGTGIEPKSAVTRDGSPFEEHNREVDALFTRYLRREIDVRGQHSFWQLQRVLANELEGPGEVLVLRCYDPDPARIVPLCYQAIEAEQLDESQHFPAGQDGVETVRGIELNRFGRPLAYWLFDAHPHGLHPLRSLRSARVPASRIIHLYEWERPSQSRGVTPNATTVQSNYDLDWLVVNTLKSAHIQSLFTAVLKRGAGQQGTGLGLDTADAPGGAWNLDQIERLGSAIIADMGQYDDIKTVAPSQPGPNLEPFIKLLLLVLAAGRGLSYVGLTGDYSQTNYSSAKAADNDDYRLISVLQADFGTDLVEVIFRDFVAMAALLGRLTYCRPSQFESDPEHWLACTLHAPGRGMIDEESESSSALVRIFGAQSTWRDELAKRGLDYREVFAQLEREWAELNARGVGVNLQMLSLALDRAAQRMVTREGAVAA